MKILTVNTVNTKGGAAEIASLLHNSINKQNNSIKSVFTYGRGKKNKSKNSFKFAYNLEAYFHALITRFAGLQGYGSYFSTKNLLNHIKNNNYDLIHLHNIHGYYLNLSFIKKIKDLNIPIAWTLHDAWPITGSCGCPMGCNKWKAGCGNCPDKYRYPKSYIDASSFMWKKKKQIFTKNWAPTIATPSSWLAKKIKKSFLKNYNIQVIPNGINTKLFKPRNKEKIRKEFNLPKNKKIILFIAADLENKIKGAKYFFESLSKIQAKNWMVVTVGKKIDSNKIDNNINIQQLGYISSRSEIAKLYNMADLFCITSLFDNLPTTVNEALSSGVPVVGFKTGGIPEQVTNDCGILVEKKNTKKLAQAISKILNESQLRNKMSQNCRKRALKEYAIPKFRDRYINLYNKLMKDIT